MRPLLHWREAGRGDRQHLERFSCARPRRKDARGRYLPHHAPWEREVELGIRTLKPPIGDGILLLGEDEGGHLAAVVLLYFLGRDGRSCFLKLAAVAVARPAQGSGFGVEAVAEALRAAENFAYGSGCGEVTVVGRIHEQNVSSSSACARNGMWKIGEAGPDQYSEWGILLELPVEFTEDG